MNLEGVTLKLLLHEEDKEKALESYAELKSDYFSNTFKSILKHIKDFYDGNGYIPSATELQIYRSRDEKVLAALSSLELIDCKNVHIELAIEELANQHAQTFTLDMLDKLLEDISLTPRDDLLDKLGTLPLKLEEVMTTSNAVHTVKDIPVFREPEALKLSKVISNICHEWDHESGGYFRQDLVLFGGKRGSGKSIVCANLVAQQHLQGNPSIYFTIEMTALETMQRIMSIVAGTSFTALKEGTLELEDKKKLAQAMVNQFVDAQHVYEKHFKNNSAPDVYKFQEELYSTCEERDDNKIIIIDDKDLSIATIDTKLSSYKSKYGDALALVVVDYINQVTIEGSDDPWDWKIQQLLSKMLKNMARKYDICLVSPYQMADDGSTRFAKGILDAADTAQLIYVDKETNTMTFKTTKARSTDDGGEHTVQIDWVCLRIDPTAVSLEQLKAALEDGEAPTEEQKAKADELALDI